MNLVRPSSSIHNIMISIRDNFLVDLITLFDIVESIVEYIVEDFSCIFSLKSFGHVLLLILSNG